ncbi:GLPGLI family protein, partial [Porphyromonas gingivalis]
MARLFFAIFLMMSALPSFSQSKAVTVSYSFEMKIPEKIKQI